MPKYRWATGDRHSFWYATRREAIQWALHERVAVRDYGTGEVVLPEHVRIEQRRPGQPTGYYGSTPFTREIAATHVRIA